MYITYLVSIYASETEKQRIKGSCLIYLTGDCNGVWGRNNANNVDLNRDFPDQFFPSKVTAIFKPCYIGQQINGLFLYVLCLVVGFKT